MFHGSFILGSYDPRLFGVPHIIVEQRQTTKIDGLLKKRKQSLVCSNSKISLDICCQVPNLNVGIVPGSGSSSVPWELMLLSIVLMVIGSTFWE